MKKIIGILIVALVAVVCAGGAQAVTKKKKASSGGGGMVATYVTYAERALQGMDQPNVTADIEVVNETNMMLNVMFPEGDRDLSRIPDTFWPQVESRLQESAAKFKSLVAAHQGVDEDDLAITRLVVCYVD